MVSGAFKRQIHDETLKYRACFGKNYYTGKFDKNNVHCIAQGVIRLKQRADGDFDLTADRLWLSGNLPGSSGDDAGYDPVLFIDKAGSPRRNDQSVRNGIFSIYTNSGKLNAREI